MTTPARPAPKPELMYAREVAELFRVDPKTVGRWASKGRLGYMTTPGGHKRYYRSEVYALLEAGEPDATEE